MEVIQNCIIFNGIDLRDYGLYVSGDKTFDSPQREVDRISIPGRSGDLFDFTGRYSNVTLEYDSILIKDYERNAASLRSILLSPTDYVRIEDNYHPNEYRMGMFLGPLNFTTLYLEAGSTTLSFDCQPQRWLKSGELPVAITDTTFTINNDTMFESKPIIHLNGKGTILFHFAYADGTSNEMTIEAPNDSIIDYYIDSESQDCYKIVGGVKSSANNLLTVDEFPTLKPGLTTITQTRTAATVSSLTITPRWFIL